MALKHDLSNTPSKKAVVPIKNFTPPIISKVASLLLWLLLASALGLLVYYQIEKPQWNWDNIFRINGFTLLIWITVIFFSAIFST